MRDYVGWLLTGNRKQNNMSNFWPKKRCGSLKKFESWSLTIELLKQYLTEKTNGFLQSGRLREVVEPSASSRPRKKQIYVDATIDDPFPFLCTGESLKLLVEYFTNHSQCKFCGEDYNLSGMTFSKQGHVCRL